jgi:hypothetical protein
MNLVEMVGRNVRIKVEGGLNAEGKLRGFEFVNEGLKLLLERNRIDLPPTILLLPLLEERHVESCVSGVQIHIDFEWTLIELMEEGKEK